MQTHNITDVEVLQGFYESALRGPEILFGFYMGRAVEYRNQNAVSEGDDKVAMELAISVHQEREKDVLRGRLSGRFMPK